MNVRRLLLILLCITAAGAAPAPPADRTPPSAIRVERRGPRDRAPAVILIPGLGGGGAVWDSTAAALESNYAVYVLTLAGFDGLPPVAPPRGDKWVAAVADLVDRERLDRPVVVGHSFGVHVAVRAAARLAEANPPRLVGLIAVDGRPVEPVPPDGQTPEQRRAQADAQAAVMRLAIGPAWENLLRLYVAQMATNPRDAERVVQMCLRSDRQTLIDATREHAEDVRPLLCKLDGVPVTVILPVPPATPAAERPAFQRNLELDFRTAFEGAADLSFRFVADANHCLMYDQPEAFARVMLEELDAVQTRSSKPEVRRR